MHKFTNYSITYNGSDTMFCSGSGDIGYNAFGMLMPGRQYRSGTGYRFGFNGKENDNEVKGEGNQQDYGFRIYDSRLGRFWSVDPLTKDYPFLTPYAFAENDVIRCIDLDGLEKVALSGTVPPEQYHKKDKSGNRIPGTTLHSFTYRPV